MGNVYAMTNILEMLEAALDTETTIHYRQCTMFVQSFRASRECIIKLQASILNDRNIDRGETELTHSIKALSYQGLSRL